MKYYKSSSQKVVESDFMGFGYQWISD